MRTKVGQRRSVISRQTKETSIKLELDIDGEGKSKCVVTDEFLRHMVETLAKYSGTDIMMTARGDIEHHLIEDAAITLGRGYREAIGSKPIKRIASATVPMDEALVKVAIDLIDRPYVHLEMPNPMYEHFLRSFAMELRATVHTIVIRGKDEHHIIEATFKALGLALKEAMVETKTTVSTKSSVKWRSS